jgi:hypothetical protein
MLQLLPAKPGPVPVTGIIVLENPTIARRIEIQVLVTTLPCNLQLLSASWRIGGKKRSPVRGFMKYFYGCTLNGF